MAEINAGLLSNASPLSPEGINKLELDVLQDRENCFVYLNEDAEICLSLPHGVHGVKDLAWHNCHTLTNRDNTFYKKAAFVKSGIDTFSWQGIYTKKNLTANWEAAELYEFDGNTDNIDSDRIIIGSAHSKFVRVSDVVIPDAELRDCIFVLSVDGTNKNAAFTKLTTGDYLCALTSSNDWSTDLAGLVNNEGCPVVVTTVGIASGLYETMPVVKTVSDDAYIDGEVVLKKGTYFCYKDNHKLSPTEGHVGTVYVKSMSCLTADEVGDIRPEVDVTAFLTFSFVNGTATITGYNGDDSLPSDLVIPDTITINSNVYTITKIDSLAMAPYERSVLQSVYFPDSLTKISSQAFAGCNTIKSVNLGANLTSVGMAAFAGCYIDEIVYRGTVDQMLVSMPNPKSSFPVANAAYIQCTDGLWCFDGTIVRYDPWPEVTNYKDVSSTLEYEYYDDDEEETHVAIITGYNSTLPSVLKIPETVDVDERPVDEVDKEAFIGCETIQIVAMNNYIFNVNTRAFSACPNLTAVYFPSIVPHVVTLSGGAFKDCAKLAEVYLPCRMSNNILGVNSIVIKKTAFAGCTALEKIVFGGTVDEWLDSADVATGWAADIPATYIQCSDGRVDIATNTRLEGDGQVYYSSAPSVMSFRSQEPLDEFNEVLINGEVVDPSNYELEEGSTIVKLSTEYLKTLSTGEYDIRVVSKNAAPRGTFTVKPVEMNEFGFYYDQPYATPYDEETMDASAFVLRKDGTVDVFAPNVLGPAATYAYTYNDGVITIGEGDEMLPLQVVNDGKTVAIEDLEFNIGGGDWMYADEEYFYHKTADINKVTGPCYVAFPVDKDKTSYGPMLNNINGVPVTLYQTYMNLPVTDVVIADGIQNTLMVCYQCYDLKTVTIPASVTSLRFAFISCDKLETIDYYGTIEQWEAISADASVKEGVTVFCSDGTVVTQN